MCAHAISPCREKALQSPVATKHDVAKGPVREGLLQTDAHQAVHATGHALLRDGRTEDVLEERLATLLVEPSRAADPAACSVNPSSATQSGRSKRIELVA